MTRFSAAPRRVGARLQSFVGQVPRHAVAASGGLTIAAAVLQAGVFFATVVIARLLGRSGLGSYATASGIGLFVVSGAGSGLPLMVLRQVAAGQVNRQFVHKALFLEFVVTVLATIPSTLLGYLLIGGLSGAVLGLLAGLSNVFFSEVALLSSVHVGLGRFRTAAIWQIVCGVAVGALTYFAIELGLGIEGTLIAFGSAAALASIGLYWELPIRSLPTQEVDTSRLFRRSQVFLGIGLIYGGYQRVDMLILYVVATASTAGIYAAAYRLLSPFALLARGFGIVFYARLSARSSTSEGSRVVTRRATRLLVLTMAPLAGLSILIAPWLIRLFYGARFTPAATPARVLLLSILPFSLYVPATHALNAAHRENRLLRVLLLSTVVEAVLVAALAARWGASGAAWAWVVTESLILAGVARERTRSLAAIPG